MNVVAGGLGVILLGMALWGARRLRGTTLVAPCLWGAASASAHILLAVAELRMADGLALSTARFAVAASTLCPLVAVLGAKRPQDRGWQWVVFTLWLIVVWIAVQTAVTASGSRLELFAAWKLFLWTLILMGPLNYLATRHWLSSVVVVIGQTIGFGQFLIWLEPRHWQFAASMGCFLLAAILAAKRGLARMGYDDLLPEQSRRWLSFRDAFGAFWGLRILQRVNESAALRQWPVRLTWVGFEKIEDDAVAETEKAEIDQTLDTLLRRFFGADGGRKLQVEEAENIIAR